MMPCQIRIFNFSFETRMFLRDVYAEKYKISIISCPCFRLPFKLLCGVDLWKRTDVYGILYEGKSQF